MHSPLQINSILLYVNKIKIDWGILPIPFPYFRLLLQNIFIIMSNFIFSYLNESVLRTVLS